MVAWTNHMRKVARGIGRAVLKGLRSISATVQFYGDKPLSSDRHPHCHSIVSLDRTRHNESTKKRRVCYSRNTTLQSASY